jgi:ABC-2 type transport system permease protein
MDEIRRLRLRLQANPIVVKELRSRMRGGRAFVVLTSMLLLLGGLSYVLYRIVLATSTYSRTPISPQVGQSLFAVLVLVELMVVCFVTPAVTAGAISGEHEQLTHEMLLVTPLRPASILRGKLFSALGYVFLLIFAAVPMASLVFLFGGVAARDMLKALVVLLAVAVMLGQVGVFCSAWLKRTARATVVSYLFVLFLWLGPLVVYILVGVLRQQEPPSWILVPNPISALFSAIAPSMGGDGDSLGGIFRSLGMALGGNLSLITGSTMAAGIPRPLYHYSLPLYGLLTLVLYFVASRLVQPVRRWQVRWKEVLGALGLLLLLATVVGGTYWATAERYEWFALQPTPAPVVMEVEPEVMIREAVVVERIVPVMPEPTVAPVPTPTPILLTPARLDAGDQAAIYLLAARELLAATEALGPLPEELTIYLSPETEDGLAGPQAPVAAGQAVPEEVQKALLAGLAADGFELVWADAPEDAQATLTLGNVHARADGSFEVSASVYADGLGLLGQLYVLQQANRAWRLMGR